MSLFKSLKCFLGFHHGGSLRYESPTSCRKIRICKYCNNVAEISTIEHDFTPFEYVDSSSCKVMKSCKRCNEKVYEDRPHTYSDLYYETPNSCQMVKACTHCCHIIYDEVKHQLELQPMIYKCTKVQICSRCNEVFKDEKHHFSIFVKYRPVDFNHYEQVYQCVDCPAEKATLINKDPNPPRRCDACGTRFGEIPYQNILVCPECWESLWIQDQKIINEYDKVQDLYQINVPTNTEIDIYNQKDEITEGSDNCDENLSDCTPFNQITNDDSA